MLYYSVYYNFYIPFAYSFFKSWTVHKNFMRQILIKKNTKMHYNKINRYNKNNPTIIKIITIIKANQLNGNLIILREKSFIDKDLIALLLPERN